MTIYLRMSGTNNRLIWVVRSIKPLNIVSSSAFGETSMKVLFFLCFLPFSLFSSSSPRTKQRNKKQKLKERSQSWSRCLKTKLRDQISMNFEPVLSIISCSCCEVVLPW